MFRLVAFVAIAAIAVATPLPANKVDGLKVRVVKDLAEAKTLYPTAEFTKLEKHSNERGEIRYTLGERVDGDRLVGQGSDKEEYSSPHDITLILDYPTGGTGDVLSYIRVDVSQSTNDGEAYVVSGGIGQRSIIFVIEAFGTTFFNYDGYLYGY